MKTISASHARNNFYNILKNVDKKVDSYTITIRGEAKAVVMNPDEVESWQETIDIMSDKNLVADILKSELEISKGETVSEEFLLRELGISPEEIR
jgi:antitoxin YefM